MKHSVGFNLNVGDTTRGQLTMRLSKTNRIGDIKLSWTNYVVMDELSTNVIGSIVTLSRSFRGCVLENLKS